MAYKKFNEYVNFIDNDLEGKLHESAFTSIIAILEKYHKTCHNNDSSKENLAWVLDAPMGHGKTTALIALLKMAGLKKSVTGDSSLLLVFNNGISMANVFENVDKFAKENYVPMLITYVDEENVSPEKLEQLKQYRFVCLTQQRLRDLAVQPSLWSQYSNYVVYNPHPNKGNKQIEKQKRSIIIDEQPIFFNETTFDVGTKNNCVEWFDKLSSSCDLNQKEVDYTRTIIADLVASEIKRSDIGGTKSLKNQLQDNEMEKLNRILDVLNKKRISPELSRKLEWFIRLFHHDDVGHIDGSSIICSQWIDYTRLGNVLILDGTASVTNGIYNHGRYKIIQSPNHHNYEDRLFIHHRDINTSYNSRQKTGNNVQTTIKEDIQVIRDCGINLLPLCSKSDIKTYIDNNTITESQRHFFDEVDSVGNTKLALNLLNVTGINSLSSFDSLALLNLPIRPPQYYRTMAVGMYGVGIDTRSSKDVGVKTGRWFYDERIELLYTQSIIADLSQIIHRTDLRNLKI